MMKSPLAPPRALPRWVKLVASAAVAFHLTAVLALALSAPSGPWLTAVGPSPALGPQFAVVVSSVTTDHYLKHLRMTHNYHFATDRPEIVGVYFEARLKDAKGEPIRTVRFPEASANPWLRHRESVLALGLGNDQPIQARPGEVIAAPKQNVSQVTYWDNSKGSVLRLETVPEHLLPRDRQISRPSEWALLLGRSYSRYLCRQYGAASAEIVRHSREPVRPELMFMEQPPVSAFTTLVSNFGEVRREE
jgi:hypothetical protein